MDEYVSKIILDVNGQQIEDFEEITEPEQELRKRVDLANKTGFCRVTARLEGTLKYVIPNGRPAFNWNSLENGTLIVTHLDGTRISYTGVSVLKVGKPVKGKDEAATQDIDWLASGLQ